MELAIELDERPYDVNYFIFIVLFLTIFTIEYITM
jgi:hypothetical protein